MFLRIFSSVTLFAALAACGSATETSEGAPEGSMVSCAIGPGSDFSDVCTFEKISGGEFVIHHPDGGFRRFALTDDAAAPIGVADGAEPLTFQTNGGEGGMLEFSMAVDRYRLDPSLIAINPE